VSVGVSMFQASCLSHLSANNHVTTNRRHRPSLLPTLYSFLCRLAALPSDQSIREGKDHDEAAEALKEAKAWRSSLSLSVEAKLFSMGPRVARPRRKFAVLRQNPCMRSCGF
jgi:hypothetical protein